ncbi:PaaI family thioesterase [Paraburkholderia fungorum]|uniref:PaaI family thioesterase n=1 Tax=Paraburkholderia fungorum TaxID=134537 RepID=UPI0038BA04F4
MVPLARDAYINATELQTIIDRSPLNQWLRMSVSAVDPSFVKVTIQWREELISSPERQSIHGGILATLIDGAGNYALAARIGRAVPTINLHVDYHRRAVAGDLLAVASPIHIGKTISTAAVEIYDREDVLVASGRGTYFTGAVSG